MKFKFFALIKVRDKGTPITIGNILKACNPIITRKMNPALLTFAHEGSTAYREKYEIIFRRESSFSNEMWQIDHCFLDIFLVHEQEGLKKPWFTIMIDDCSRAISGFYLSFDAPCAVNTALALRQGIWRKSNTDWQV